MHRLTLLPYVVQVNPWGAGSAWLWLPHDCTIVMAFPWGGLSQTPVQRLKLLARDRRNHLLQLAVGSRSPSDTAACPESAAAESDFEGSCMDRGSRPAPCQAPCCAQHFCFMCMLVLHFPALTESSGEDGPISLGVNCLRCPLAIPVSAEVSSNILTCGRSLKAAVGSVCARRSQGSPCSHWAPVRCWVGDLAFKRYLFVHLVQAGR